MIHGLMPLKVCSLVVSYIRVPLSHLITVHFPIRDRARICLWCEYTLFV